MNIRLINHLSTIILAWFIVTGAHAKGKAEIPTAHDFTLIASRAKTIKAPILVLFSQRNCAYCAQVLREFLIPMTHNASYDHKMIMVQINMHSKVPLRNFSGQATTQANFAKMHQIKITPTIKLFDEQGRELTEPLIGLTTPDYYGGFLDQRIDEALAKVRSKK